MRFAGICLITEDVPRLVDFYQRVLGITFDGDAIHAQALIDGAGFAIYARSAANQDMRFGLGPVHGTGNVTLMFQVDDVDAAYARLLPFVTSFITRPNTYQWGARAVHFFDPDGNIVDFFCPPTG